MVRYYNLQCWCWCCRWYISELSEDDNIAGTLKKNWPKTFGFIPDNIATLDGDSPDTKRMKNVVEGVGLGLFTDVIWWRTTGYLMQRVLLDAAFRWIPENEKAGNWFKKNLDDIDDVY